MKLGLGIVSCEVLSLPTPPHVVILFIPILLATQNPLRVVLHMLLEIKNTDLIWINLLGFFLIFFL